MPETTSSTIPAKGKKARTKTMSVKTPRVASLSSSKRRGEDPQQEEEETTVTLEDVETEELSVEGNEEHNGEESSDNTEEEINRLLSEAQRATKPKLGRKRKSEAFNVSESMLQTDQMEHSIQSAQSPNSFDVEIVQGIEPKRSRSGLTMHNGKVLLSEPDIMLKSLDYNAVYKFREEWNVITPDVRQCMDIYQHIAPELHPILESMFSSTDEDGWREWTDDNLLNQILKWLPRSNEHNHLGQTAEERLLSLRLINFNGMDIKPVMLFLVKFFREFDTWEPENLHVPPEEKTRKIGKIISEIITSTKRKSPDKSVIAQLATQLSLHGTFKTPREFGKILLDKAKEAIRIVSNAMKYGMMCTNVPTDNGGKEQTNSSHGKGKEGAQRSTQQVNKSSYPPRKDSGNQQGATCTGCGRSNHTVNECKLTSHPDFNAERGVKWADSVPGKAWAAIKNREGNPFLVLPGKLNLKDQQQRRTYQRDQPQGNNNNRGKYKKCKPSSLLALTSNTILTEIYPFPYVRGEITALSGNELAKPIPIRILLDTGALNANYISSCLLTNLKSRFDKIFTIKIIPTKETTLSADNSILNCQGQITCDLSLRKIENQSSLTLTHTLLKVINMNYDVILGLPAIKTHNLITEHFSSLFSNEKQHEHQQHIASNRREDNDLYTSDSSSVSSLPSPRPRRQSQLSESLTRIAPSAKLEVQRSLASGAFGSESLEEEGGPFSVRASNHKPTAQVAVHEIDLAPPNINSQNVLLLIRSKEEALGIQLEEEDEVTQQRNSFYILDEVMQQSELSEEEILNMIQFEGSTPLFNNRIKEVCRKYIKVFQKELSKEAAMIPPFDIQVDKSKWEQNDNRQPPRKQGPAKEKEIFRQVTEMLKHGIIRPSNATEYSQVLLAPKNGGDWRFCIDFRRLNEATTQIGWPLPNIKSMLHRLGSRKAKIFGKMDFTKGYYQAALAEASRKFTAFITYCGIYEWLRVPMGLKGAPAYFQFMIATMVLSGLLYICCELYIDDVIVYGQNEDEFIANLIQILERLQTRKVSLNPKKCQFGAKEVEFVGHIIDENGLRMSEAKLQKVIDFTKPMVAKGLKSFLGLANYFRDHIKNHSHIVRPLQNMIRDYKKGHKLYWNEETSNSFNEIKMAINNCPKIFFVQDDAPIFLHTDASKYAIGAYLFQIVQTKEQPIAFLSKTLTDSQLNWSTFEKEAYAIYYAFHELEYLLHDRHFTLRTDHANLAFIKDSGSEKVRRWKLYIQDYNFHIEHIKGEHNIVADALSRLVFEPSDREHLLNLTQDSIIPHHIYKAIGKCHNSVVGHHGVQRTLGKLSNMRFKTKYLHEYVKLFIRRCPACQKMSQIKPVIETIPFTTASYAPMHKISMDSIGPLPESTAGFKHILVIVDCFSRWVELYPCHTVEAEEAAKHLISFVGRFGCPKEIISDNGSQFVNEVIDSFIKVFGAQHLLTIPHSKEENAIVERVNKEVMRHLRHWIYDKNIIDEWEQAIPLIQRIINTAVHSSTGYAPAQVVYGNRVNLDRNIMIPFEVAESSVAMPLFVQKYLEIQRKIVATAVVSQILKDNSHRANFTKLPTEYQIGSYVLAQYPENRMGRMPPTKFHTQWKGPMQVISNIGSKYTVRNLVTGKLEDYHVTALKYFTVDNEHTDPEKVAQKDYKTYITEAILDHRPKTKLRDLKRSRLQFLVKWQGYPDEQNTWEPLGNLRRNLHVHEYMRRHKLASLIPRKLRDVGTSSSEDSVSE